MMSSAIPARLQFQCGHAALVTLPRIKGETATQRNDRVAREKSAALARQCDFCAPAVSIAITGNRHSIETAAYAPEPEVILAVAEPEQDVAIIAETIAAEPELAEELAPVESIQELLAALVEAPGHA